LSLFAEPRTYDGTSAVSFSRQDFRSKSGAHGCIQSLEVSTG